MKKEQRFIISKKRFLGGKLHSEKPEYTQLNEANYYWMNEKADATRFINQRRCVDFLQKYNIDGATIEEVYEPVQASN